MQAPLPAETAALATAQAHDEQEQVDEPAPKKKPTGKKSTVKKPALTGKGGKKGAARPQAEVEAEIEDEDSPEPVKKSAPKAAKRGKAAARAQAEVEDEDAPEPVSTKPGRKPGPKPQLQDAEAQKDDEEAVKPTRGQKRPNDSAGGRGAKKPKHTIAPLDDVPEVGEDENAPAQNDDAPAQDDDPGNHYVPNLQRFDDPTTEQLLARHSAFFASNPYDDFGQWQGQVSLGAGSYGVTNVLYQTNDHGQIFDRIVVKDSFFPGHELSNYTVWYSDGDVRDLSTRTHMEIKAMQDITDQEVFGPTKCVRYRADKQDIPKLFYRLYMAFYPHGDLQSVFKPRPTVRTRGRAARKGKKEAAEPELDPSGAYGDDNEVPEPTIWKWFEDLTEACLVMAYGRIPSPDENFIPDKSWKKIVHRDIKPLNIFLGSPSNKDNDWPTLPIAHLGDFGKTIHTSPTDPLNPLAYNQGDGTAHYMPLEQICLQDKTTAEDVFRGKLGDATNVWAIGACLTYLMNRDNPTKPRDPKTEFLSEEDVEPRFNGNAVLFYSEELRGLLGRCTRYWFEDRIGLRELYGEIRRYTGLDGTVVDRAEGMRTARPPVHDIKMRALWKDDTLVALGGLAPAQDADQDGGRKGKAKKAKAKK